MPDYKKELEDFTYIVSHDLNAPLRHIKSFSSLLVKKLDDKITDQEREYVRHLENSVLKIEIMLEALLTYSRLSTQTEDYSPFDCNQLVQDVISSFQDPIEETQAKITVSGLPENLNADQKQIKLLFMHLLDNALKFRKPGTPPDIKISAEQKDDHWLFCIKDNGIGIPEKQYESVFTMFKRLNPDDGLSGIGAGLTMAKKTMDLHGGGIWVEAQGNDGTALFFTIK